MAVLLVEGGVLLLLAEGHGGVRRLELNGAGDALFRAVRAACALPRANAFPAAIPKMDVN